MQLTRTPCIQVLFHVPRTSTTHFSINAVISVLLDFNSWQIPILLATKTLSADNIALEYGMIERSLNYLQEEGICLRKTLFCRILSG